MYSENDQDVYCKSASPWERDVRILRKISMFSVEHAVLSTRENFTMHLSATGTTDILVLSFKKKCPAQKSLEHERTQYKLVDQEK